MATHPQQTQTPSQTPALPDRLPVLPLRGTVVFPLMVAPLHVGQARSLRLIQDLGPGNRTLGLFAVRNEQIEEPGPLYERASFPPTDARAASGPRGTASGCAALCCRYAGGPARR